MCLETDLAIFEKLGEFFFKSSGHPARDKLAAASTMKKKVLYH
jgi:hypothetical protein